MELEWILGFKKFELKIKDYTIEETKEIKFLGIKIPTDLKFTSHYEHVIAKKILLVTINFQSIFSNSKNVKKIEINYFIVSKHRFMCN